MRVCVGVGFCVCEGLSGLSVGVCECCLVLMLLVPPSVSSLVSTFNDVFREGSDRAVMGDLPLKCPFITFSPIFPWFSRGGLEHTWRSPVDVKGRVLVWMIFSGGGVAVSDGCTNVCVFVLLCWVVSRCGE